MKSIEAYDLIQDEESDEQLISVVSSSWYRENKNFYTQLVSRCNNIFGEELDTVVDRILNDEIKYIATEIKTSQSAFEKWRQWLGWINFMKLLSADYDPINMICSRS